MFKIFFFEAPQNMLESMFAFLLYTFLVWPEQNLRYFSLRCADSLFIVIINLNSKSRWS